MVKEFALDSQHGLAGMSRHRLSNFGGSPVGYGIADRLYPTQRRFLARVWQAVFFSEPRLSYSQETTPLPAAGYRNNSSGALSNVGSNGYYWSATPNSTNNGRNLNFNSSNWNWNNNNRANGFSVRPVAAITTSWRLSPHLFK